MNHGIAEINARFAQAFPEHERLVQGAGGDGALILLVGEAPGAQEEAQLRPFVGAAGKNLDTFLEHAGLSREEIYITNAVKFRPTKAGKSGRLSNRTPTRAEVLAFVPWLLEEIEAARPALTVTLGNTALYAVTGEKRVIGSCHGKTIDTRVGRVFPLYHPASVIYRRELWQVYLDDLAKLRSEAHRITETIC